MRFRLALILAALTAAASCGFHMRGSGASAMEIQAEKIYVGQGGDVSGEVRELLKLSGVTLTATPEGAEYIIRISDEHIERDVLSVSPQTGKVEEYQLTLRLLLSLTQAGGEKLIDANQIALARDFTFDQDAVMGKFSEEELLRDELTREAAEQVLRRVGAVISTRRS